MAATVKTYFDFGGSDGNAATNQEVDALGPPMLRFKQADDATIDSNNPIPVPAAGTERSYWKHIYFKCTGGTFTQIDNIKLYGDGGDFGTGITLYIGDQNPTNNSGAPESGYEVADTTNSMVTDHTGISARTDVHTYTSGSPRTINISESGSIINASGEMTDYTVWQMEVDNTATAGDLTDEDFTWQYDEI
jgi:hypothetical protein